MNKKLLCLTIIIISSLSIKSQTLLSSMGGVMKNSQATVSYSMGEDCIQLYKYQTVTIAQGFEQCTISTATAITQINKDEPLFFVYQNTGYINYYNAPLEENYSFSILSISGQELLNGYLNGEPINATAIDAGTYLIQVCSKQQTIGAYKILIY